MLSRKLSTRRSLKHFLALEGGASDPASFSENFFEDKGHDHRIISWARFYKKFRGEAHGYHVTDIEGFNYLQGIASRAYFTPHPTLGLTNILS
jgi:hypothetical protein